MQEGGVDIIEIGIPFSDPLADGKTIQYSTQVALANGVTLKKCFEILRDARSLGLKVPVVFMGYANPLMNFGISNFMKASKEVGGVDGLIVVDLPLQEADDLIDACSINGVSFIPLISPTTSEKRLSSILNSISPQSFVYVISAMGVTGQRSEVNVNLPDLIARVKKYTDCPVAVGFGVSDKDQFEFIAQKAEGVVIGSKIIQVIREAHQNKENVQEKLKIFLQSLKSSKDIELTPSKKLIEAGEIHSESSTELHFGAFGGRFAPETLMFALDELNICFENLKNDDSFIEEYRSYYSFINRPSQFQFGKNMTAHCKGARFWYKREDLNHTGSHKINNALGQILLARRLGKKRIIAETGAGQHGVATATICAHFGLPCRIYMGKTDVERQALNVFRIRLLGAEVIPVEKIEHSNDGTLKDAINEAMRGEFHWVTNVNDTHYVVGSAIGPHPFPKIVAEFQSVIGKETKEQFPVAIKKEFGIEKKLPDLLISCVGGGSNAIGLFGPFLKDLNVRLVGCQAGGQGIESGHHSSPLVAGRPGILHGCKTYLIQNEDGQVGDTHSISAGLDYPGVGPQHAFLKDSGRAEYVAVTDEEALEGFKSMSRIEGIMPALETSHAIYHAMRIAKTLPPDFDIVINISGRGDKDVQHVQKLLKTS